MAQIVHISIAKGTASICSSFEQCLTFRLSDPALPSDVLDMLNNLLSTEAAGNTSFQMERRGDGAVTYVVSEDGAVEAQNASAISFGQIMSSFSRISSSGLSDASFDASPEPPDTTSVPKLSFAQLMIGLVSEGWITEVEGTAWLEGTLPFAVSLVIDTLPTNQQFAAKARAIRPSEIIRDDPLVSALAVAQGKTPEEIDDFFVTYSGV